MPIPSHVYRVPLVTVGVPLGCKIDYNKKEGSMKITQPVMIQSFEDKFNLPEGTASNTSAISGSLFTAVQDIYLFAT